jgi:hypothetical protein
LPLSSFAWEWCHTIPKVRRRHLEINWHLEEGFIPRGAFVFGKIPSYHHEVINVFESKNIVM